MSKTAPLLQPSSLLGTDLLIERVNRQFNQVISPQATNLTMDSIRIPELRGASLAIQTDQRREIILSGPARSSKTFGILWKFHYAAMQNPGCRFLFLRKTRESMAESVLAAFEHDVVGDQHFIVQGGARRSGRHSYQYDNGSEIVL